MRQRWLRVLFRRRMLTILLLLLQVYFLICLVLGGSQLSRNFSRLLTIVSIIAVLYIVSQKDKGAYKTAWAILILTFPLFGGLMYLLSNAQSSKWCFAKSVLHTQQKAKPLYALPGICYESATKQLPEYYPQIQKHITLHRVNESWKHFWRNLKKPRSTYFWNISSCKKALCGTASWKF